MTDHNGVLMMQRLLLAGTIGLAVARKARRQVRKANARLVRRVRQALKAIGQPLSRRPEPDPRLRLAVRLALRLFRTLARTHPGSVGLRRGPARARWPRRP